MISYIRLIGANFLVLLFCVKGASCETTSSQATAVLSQTFILSSITTSGNHATQSQNIQINGDTTDVSLAEVSSASTPTSSAVTSDSAFPPFSSGSIILDHLSPSLSSSLFSSLLTSSSPSTATAENKTTSLSSSTTLSQPALSSLLSSSTLSQLASLSSSTSRNGQNQDIQSTPMINKEQSTFNKERSTSAFNKEQSTPTFNKEQSTPTFNKEQSTPTFNKEQSTPTFNKEQSTPTFNKEQSTPTSIPPNSSFFTGSQSGWAAGPAIGGILGLTALFASAYIIGKEKRRRGNPLTRTAASSQSFNENPAFASSDAESQPKAMRIQKFASYVDELHKDGDKKFHSQYQMLMKLTLHHEKSASELPQNRNKNRYANILPYDASRVKLNPSDVDQQATDYINASYIPGRTYRREYIAAQGPLSNTLADFWRMIWEQNVSCIVMLTNLKEDGKDKCAKYWPSKSDARQDEFLSYGEVQVCLASESVLAHYIIRILKVQMDEVCRTVRQYHFLDWTENSPPTDMESFLNFTRDVRAFSNRNAPVLVHCSSGSGRTGTFILVDRMLQVVDGDGKLDLFRATLEMRNNRIFMVQTESQYVFAHDAIKRAVNEKSFGALHQGFDGFDDMLP